MSESVSTNDYVPTSMEDAAGGSALEPDGTEIFSNSGLAGDVSEIPAGDGHDQQDQLSGSTVGDAAPRTDRGADTGKSADSISQALRSAPEYTSSPASDSGQNVGKSTSEKMPDSGRPYSDSRDIYTEGDGSTSRQGSDKPGDKAAHGVSDGTPKAIEEDASEPVKGGGGEFGGGGASGSWDPPPSPTERDTKTPNANSNEYTPDQNSNHESDRLNIERDLNSARALNQAPEYKSAQASDTQKDVGNANDKAADQQDEGKGLHDGQKDDGKLKANPNNKQDGDKNHLSEPKEQLTARVIYKDSLGQTIYEVEHRTPGYEVDGPIPFNIPETVRTEKVSDIDKQEFAKTVAENVLQSIAEYYLFKK